jgi:hypothetical protein
MGVILSTGHVKRVNALPKVTGFRAGVRFPPTGKVDRVGRINIVRKVISQLL